MAENKDYYKILGVSKTATEDELKCAFRKLSMTWHPDRQAGKSDTEKKDAEEKFKEIAEAYSVLSDKDKRAHYDRFGTIDGIGGTGGFSGSPFSGFSMHDFMSKMNSMNGFNDFGFDFGGTGPSHRRDFDPNQPERGADLEYVVDITFKQSVFGCTKEFDLKLQKECADCNGTGFDPSIKPETCQHCQGTGTLQQQQRTPWGVSITQTTCPHCQGRGHSAKYCKTCHGEKRLPDDKHISVKVPAGINNGQRLRVVGKGQCGVCGGEDGNLYVRIRAQSSDVFDKIENDVYLNNFPISPIVATLGGKIEVPTLNGYKTLSIPAGTRNGQKFRISGQGCASPNGTGDFYVVVSIEPFDALTHEQKHQLEELQKTLSEKNNSKLVKLRENAEKFYN